MAGMAEAFGDTALLPWTGCDAFEEAGRVVREYHRHIQIAGGFERPNPVDVQHIDLVPGDGFLEGPVGLPAVDGFEERRIEAMDLHPIEFAVARRGIEDRHREDVDLVAELNEGASELTNVCGDSAHMGEEVDADQSDVHHISIRRAFLNPGYGEASRGRQSLWAEAFIGKSRGRGNADSGCALR